MGAPVDTGLENFEEAILKLSVADRVKLIHWISETVVDEEPEVEAEVDNNWPPRNLGVEENPSNKTPWYEGITPVGELTEGEWKVKVNEAAGAWADHPMTAEELIDDIYESRTISTREINLDD